MAQITEPFPISRVANRHLIFDVDVISYARREHNICGVLIGTIPNLSQQNIFLGIPVELMPEEARLLVEQGHAYIVDDVTAHKAGMMELSRKERLAYMQMLDKEGTEIAVNAKRKSDERTEKALKQKGLEYIAQERSLRRASKSSGAVTADSGVDTGDENALFDSTPSSSAVLAPKEPRVEPYFITPTTSHSSILKRSTLSSFPLPEVSRSYPLFKYLHSQGFFSTPGLRFGCHYTVYPGDPLRFHSHFLATGFDWNEEFDLLDIVGGGRLGTGVKKAYLVGGENPSAREEERMRAFSVEWGGM